MFFILQLLIDADACPVVDLALFVSSRYEIIPILFCDTSHRVERENVKTIIVDKGPDSVDFKLVSILNKGDIVITGDYGLAAMCLAKGGIVITHNGKELTSDNIDQLLAIRYESAKIRRAGGRTKGPKKRTEENNLEFETQFRQICERAILVRGGTANE
ncbi:YaiI/YqxD family protein [Lysinibacillus sp. 2017]|uniref:YaiI/YqxD family protein n=1 Tax=unclassified Lysinibacillus TaxID=2636778 RepID=UPI000D52940D|nr:MULTISPECIES: YaiI/YqxD family protein [unclassified Lysinibacillus]AWE07061.1 YaiI/YqxD family protein [Lysinibacillus sp. 2017]TGN37434.1 YaiI/YqxD family protein [Lysinibacillus sp. S2017]